jgi:hypothetical protein
MRANLVSPSSAHLSYAIRDIVKFAEVVREHGVEITWENIGDPIAKGGTISRDLGAIAPRRVLSMYARRWPPT